MIGAFLNRSHSTDELVVAFTNDMQSLVKVGSKFIAWSTKNSPHTCLAYLSDSADTSRITTVCGLFGNLLANDLLKEQLDSFVTDQQRPLSPASFLALGYRHIGCDFIAAIEGEFSIFIYDADEDCLISRTDNMGIQRFYYSHNSESYCICTELGGLLRVVQPSGVRNESLRDYFFLGYIPAPETIYSGIYKTMPNHSQVFRADSWQLKDVETPSVRAPKKFSSLFENATSSDVEDMFLSEMEKSIEKRLNGATTSSVLLTSGYDSSLCASILKARCKNVYAYTIGFKERHANENEAAKRIASHLGLHHRDLIFSADQLLDSLVEWVQAHAEPWCHPNGLSTYLALGEVRNYSEDATVFDGSGGDYLFRDFGERAKLVALEFLLPKPPPYLKSILFYLLNNIPSWRARKYLQEVYTASMNNAEDRLVFHCPWNVEEYKNLIGSDYSFSDSRPGKEYFSAGRNALDRYLAYYRSWGFDASVGRAVIESNLQGIRATFPYEDFNLVSFVENIPNSLKFRKGSRRYLQENVSKRFIPESFFASRKKAMETPLELILNTDRGLDLVNHYLAKRREGKSSVYNTEYVELIKNEFYAGRMEYALKLWNILVFEIWDESQSY